MSRRSRSPFQPQDRDSDPDSGFGLGSGLGPGRERRPWFGPKRFGLGYRPQTWQGYTVVIGLMVLVTVLAKTSDGGATRVLVVVIPLAVAVVIRVLSGRR
jgi:hypothetical protein